MGDNIVYKKCTKCKKDKDATEFITKLNKPSVRCANCMDIGRKADAKRPPRDRKEEQKAYEARPETKAMRAAYDAANPVVAIKGNLKHRQKQNKDKETKRKALDHNNEVMAIYRAANPDKMKKVNDKKKLNKKSKLKICMDTAENKGNTWELTKEYAFELFSSNCYYCNYISDITLTGIDRVDNNGHYTVDNVKPCCQDCNYMKNTLDITTFIKRCIHIATYNELYDGVLYPKRFNDIVNVDYGSYVERATKKKLVFDKEIITQEVFNNIVSKDCYICGKKSDTTNINGLDRFDNSIGYTLDNVRPCCNNCNIMKSTNSHTFFLNKCKDIAEHCKLENIDTKDIPINRQLTPTKNVKQNIDRAGQRELRYQANRDKQQEPDFIENKVKELLELRRVKALNAEKQKDVNTIQKTAIKDTIQKVVAKKKQIVIV